MPDLDEAKRDPSLLVANDPAGLALLHAVRGDLTTGDLEKTSVSPMLIRTLIQNGSVGAAVGILRTFPVVEVNETTTVAGKKELLRNEAVLAGMETLLLDATESNVGHARGLHSSLRLQQERMGDALLKAHDGHFDRGDYIGDHSSMARMTAGVFLARKGDPEQAEVMFAWAEAVDARDAIAGAIAEAHVLSRKPVLANMFATDMIKNPGRLLEAQMFFHAYAGNDYAGNTVKAVEIFRTNNSTTANVLQVIAQLCMHERVDAAWMLLDFVRAEEKQLALHHIAAALERRKVAEEKRRAIEKATQATTLATQRKIKKPLVEILAGRLQSTTAPKPKEKTYNSVAEFLASPPEHRQIEAAALSRYLGTHLREHRPGKPGNIRLCIEKLHQIFKGDREAIILNDKRLRMRVIVLRTNGILHQFEIQPHTIGSKKTGDVFEQELRDQLKLLGFTILPDDPEAHLKEFDLATGRIRQATPK